VSRETGPELNVVHVRRRLEASGYPVGADLPPIAWFGDTRDQADELARLVQRGRKTATAGLLWKWRHDGKPVPAPGDRQVVVDWSGTPRAVIEMTEVSVVSFDEVDAGFARAEGEGDLSLAYWRRVHWDFFARECARIGRDPTRTMPTICMRFRVVQAIQD
jgi:uncharacterized protein YhfF